MKYRNGFKATDKKFFPKDSYLLIFI